MKRWELTYNNDEGKVTILIIAEVCYKLSSNTIYADKVAIRIFGEIEDLNILE